MTTVYLPCFPPPTSFGFWAEGKKKRKKKKEKLKDECLALIHIFK